MHKGASILDFGCGSGRDIKYFLGKGMKVEAIDGSEELCKMAAALKENGIIYTSFKYSKFEGERNGRYFTDFTINTFQDFVSDMDHLVIEESWIIGDVRLGRGDEKWLNLILRKI